MAVIAHIMLGRKQGGLENTLVAYCHCLVALNHIVHVIVDPRAAIVDQLQAIPGIHIHYFKQHGLWDVIARTRFNFILKKINPDLVFLLGNRAMSFALPLKKKYPIVPITANYKLKYLLKFDYAIAMTKQLKNIILTANTIGTDKLFLLANPVIVPEFTEKEENNTLVIGALGRFVTNKGFDIFLNSLALLRQQGLTFNAILAGAGEEEMALKQLANQLQLTDYLAFPGWLKPSDFFNRIDIFCFPSNHEPFGNVLIEAFASCTAIVSTLSEGPSEIATDQVNALMVPISDSEMLADRLKLLLTDVNLRKKLADNGFKAYCDNHHIRKIQVKLNDIILKILHHKNDD